jgi:hypothetical protein
VFRPCRAYAKSGLELADYAGQIHISGDVFLDSQTLKKMKSKILMFVATAFFMAATGGAASSTKNENQPSNPPSATQAPDAATGEDIVGEWEMVGSVVDTNDNLQIDESEREKLKETIKDRMKLNRDGSGVFTVAEMPGRYEIKDPGNSGKRVLTWYDKANGRHRIGTIIKVTQDELHIKEPGGHGLFVWKRLRG